MRTLTSRLNITAMWKYGESDSKGATLPLGTLNGHKPQSEGGLFLPPLRTRFSRWRLTVVRLGMRMTFVQTVQIIVG